MSEVLRELSQSLGEDERRALLKKINESLSFNADSVDNIYHKDPNREERRRMVEAEISRLNWVQRFLLWLRRTFTGKSLTNAYNDSRLAVIRRTINRKIPGYIGFETQVLYEKFGKRIFTIFKDILPLREGVKRIWSQSEYFQAILAILIEERLEKVVQNIEDLVTLDEMVEVYAANGTKALLRAEISDRLEKYTDTIKPEIFSKLEESILPIYYLKEIVMFPFNSLFQFFHYVEPRDMEESEPFFKTASANLILDMLERLYYSVYIVSKISDQSDLDDDLLSRLFSQEADGEEIPDLVPAIKAAIKTAQKFNKDVPLADIIRYFHKDPYYQLIFYMPTMNLQEFYLSILKMRLLADLDHVFEKVRDTYIDREVAKFFHNKRFINFRNYRMYTSIDYKAAELPFFIHTRSVNLVYNYLINYYKEHMQDIVRILERSVIDQNRITRDRLLSHASNLEDLEDKILQFDQSLSNDAEDGKQFHRLRFTLASDPTHQKMFRTLVIQKDREVKSLIERAHESLSGLAKVFQEILYSKSDNVKIQLRSHFFFNNKPTSLENLLTIWSDHIDQFLNLFNQILRIEKGRSSK